MLRSDYSYVEETFRRVSHSLERWYVCSDHVIGFEVSTEHRTCYVIVTNTGICSIYAEKPEHIYNDRKTNDIIERFYLTNEYVMNTQLDRNTFEKIRNFSFDDLQSEFWMDINHEFDYKEQLIFGHPNGLSLYFDGGDENDFLRGLALGIAHYNVYQNNDNISIYSQCEDEKPRIDRVPTGSNPGFIEYVEMLLKCVYPVGWIFKYDNGPYDQLSGYVAVPYVNRYDVRDTYNILSDREKMFLESSDKPLEKFLKNHNNISRS